MHKYIPARRNSKSPRNRPIVRIRIRNVNRFVKLAARIARIQNVLALGSFVIPLPRLRPDRFSAKGHLVGFHNLPAAKQLQRVLSLQHDNTIRMQRLFSSLRTPYRADEQSRKHKDSHARIIATLMLLKC